MKSGGWACRYRESYRVVLSQDHHNRLWRWHSAGQRKHYHYLIQEGNFIHIVQTGSIEKLYLQFLVYIVDALSAVLIKQRCFFNQIHFI